MDPGQRDARTNDQSPEDHGTPLALPLTGETHLSQPLPLHVTTWRVENTSHAGEPQAAAAQLGDAEAGDALAAAAEAEVARAEAASDQPAAVSAQATAGEPAAPAISADELALGIPGRPGQGDEAAAVADPVVLDRNALERLKPSPIAWQPSVSEAPVQDANLWGRLQAQASRVNRQAAELPLDVVASTGLVKATADIGEDPSLAAAQPQDGLPQSVLALDEIDRPANPVVRHGVLPPANHEIRTELEAKAGGRAANSADVWKSLVWLGTMIAAFLAAITVGPRVIEQYQYAATRGKMRAQYEVATEVLSRVSFRETSVSSELVVHRIRPSVVSIHAKARATRRNREGFVRGQGSGVIVSEDGLIVTNNHVIDGAENLVVTLADRREFLAKVVGRDNETDLAVLKIEANDLIPAEWGDSDSLELGSSVWAMGSPFGLDQTVTRGIISGKHRRTADNTGQANPHQDLLQTDAAINPGNSGGPLVNSSGQVVGINTSIYGEFFQGISFAVPSALAREIVDKLIKHGEVRRGFLGVFPASVTHQDAIRLNLPDISGAILTLVEPEAPAGRAGLQVDDVIVRIGGQPIENDVLLFRQIALTEPGAETVIEYFRDGALVSTTVKVGNKPQRRF
jgi:S1-C subfamily serine protease